jgi:5,10-methylenetetrahydromethanopterin reductase
VRIGWNGGGNHSSLAELRAEARWAAHEGFASYWVSQIAGPDALTALAVVGAETPQIELGTSIVPLYGRHVLVLAAQALTANAAAGGRLVLGIGPSHQPVVEGMYGESYAKPFTRTRETLAALRALLAGEALDLQGEELRVRGRLAIQAMVPPVLVAALGPRMLELAGREAQGTILWMVGPRTLRAHITPRIREAAAQAGRPAPRVVAGLPVCVTDDVPAARAFAAQKLALYGTLPAYRAMLEREGVSGPGDLLVAGSESKVVDALAEVAAAGATDLRAGALCASAAENERTRALLASLARRGGLS